MAFDVDSEVGGGGVMGMGQLRKAQRRSRFIEERHTHKHKKNNSGLPAAQAKTIVNPPLRPIVNPCHIVCERRRSAPCVARRAEDVPVA